MCFQTELQTEYPSNGTSTKAIYLCEYIFYIYEQIDISMTYSQRNWNSMKTKRDIIKIQALASEFGTGSHIILPRSWKGKRVVCMLKTDFDKIKGEKKEWSMLQWQIR